VKRALSLALICFLFASCGELLEPAAAVVDGEKITVDEVSTRLSVFTQSDEFARLAEQGDPKSLERQVEQQVLSQLIRRAVLLPRARTFGIEVTDDLVTKRLEEIKAEFPNPGAFEETLKEQGLSPDQLRDLVFNNVLEEQLRAEVTKGAGPTEADLKNFYEQNQSDFSETRAQHILVAEKSQATGIARQLQDAPEGQVDKLFKQLAKRFSTDGSNSDSGGDLGYFTPGQFVPEFETAADKLDIGEISDPVQSQFGFHIIRVTDRRVAPFEDVRADITQQLSQGASDKAWNDYLRGAYEEADVKVNPRYGEFDIESLQVVNATSSVLPGAVESSPTPTSTGLPGN
jgi:foldase protein PrsA